MFFYAQVPVTGTDEQTISLEENQLPTSPVGRIVIEFTTTEVTFTVRQLVLEACVKYTGEFFSPRNLMKSLLHYTIQSSRRGQTFLP